MTFGLKAGLIGLSLVLAAPMAAQAADAAKGATLVKQRCSVCHSLVVDTGPRPGPSMKGLAGRKAASVPNFKYSPALQKSGITWTPAKLDQFLAAPSKAVPGTFMAIAVPNPTERADIVAYLSTLK
jgi:cytochrome c